MSDEAELLAALTERNQRWWDAERRLIDAYWDGPDRTLATDLRWLAGQCHKELCDGVVVRAVALHEALALPSPASWTDLDRAVDGIRTEHGHLRAFAAVHDRWAPSGTPALVPAAVVACGWPENDELMALRGRHRAEHPHLGPRAFALTEGGGGALYASGAARAGRGGRDDDIASACAAVEEDERHHRHEGVLDLDVSAADLELLAELSEAQSRARLRMRWAQFSRPISERELRAIEG